MRSTRRVVYNSHVYGLGGVDGEDRGSGAVLELLEAKLSIRKVEIRPNRSAYLVASTPLQVARAVVIARVLMRGECEKVCGRIRLKEVCKAVSTGSARSWANLSQLCETMPAQAQKYSYCASERGRDYGPGKRKTKHLGGERNRNDDGLR